MNKSEENTKSKTFSVRDLTPEQLKFKYARQYLGQRFRMKKYNSEEIIQDVFLEFLRLDKKFENYNHFARVFTLTCKHRYKDRAIRYKKVLASHMPYHKDFIRQDNEIEKWESNYDANKLVELLKVREVNQTGKTPTTKLKIFEKMLDFGGRTHDGKGGVRELAREVGIGYNNFTVSLYKLRKELRKLYAFDKK